MEYLLPYLLPLLSCCAVNTREGVRDGSSGCHARNLALSGDRSTQLPPEEFGYSAKDGALKQLYHMQYHGRIHGFIYGLLYSSATSIVIQRVILSFAVNFGTCPSYMRSSDNSSETSLRDRQCFDRYVTPLSLKILMC